MINTEPSRKIPKNYRNITGKFSSQKANRLISYESKLERDFLYLYELDNSIINILEQPITIEYTFNDQTYTYTPDFFLKTPDDYDDILVEVKYYNELKESFAQSRQKYKAIVEYVRDKDIDFVFHTDRCPYIQSDDYKFNVHFLLNYNTLENDHYDAVCTLFKPYISIQQLLESYSDDTYEQLSLLSTIWCMIRRKILEVDLFEKLTTSTQLIKLRPFDEQKYKAHFNGDIKQGYLLWAWILE